MVLAILLRFAIMPAHRADYDSVFGACLLVPFLVILVWENMATPVCSRVPELSIANPAHRGLAGVVGSPVVRGRHVVLQLVMVLVRHVAIWHRTSDHRRQDAPLITIASTAALEEGAMRVLQWS